MAFASKSDDEGLRDAHFLWMRYITGEGHEPADEKPCADIQREFPNPDHAGYCSYC